MEVLLFLPSDVGLLETGGVLQPRSLLPVVWRFQAAREMDALQAYNIRITLGKQKGGHAIRQWPNVKCGWVVCCDSLD